MKIVKERWEEEKKKYREGGMDLNEILVRDSWALVIRTLPNGKEKMTGR